MISTNNLESYTVATACETLVSTANKKLTVGFDDIENRLCFFTRHPAVDV